MLIKTDKIKVATNRQRQDLGDLQSLAESIARLGQIQPIIIDRQFNLIAGERRFRAIQLLKQELVRAEYCDAAEPETKEIIELEENYRRLDLSWPERARATRRLSQLTKKSLRELEAFLGRAKSSISEDLDLACALDEMPELAAISSAKTALRVYKTVMRSTLSNQLTTNQQTQTQTAEKPKLWQFDQGNCVELIQLVADSTVDLVLTDPPFGINIDSNSRHIGGYADSKDLLLQTISDLAKGLFRTVKLGGHLYMFCVESQFSALSEIITAAGFEHFGQPVLVWSKTTPTDPGLHNQSTFWPMHELIIVAFKPPYRPLNSLGPVGSVLSYSPLLPSLKIHPYERPQPLLRRLIELSSLVGDTVLDPFAGSGSTLLAANSLGRRSIGFELDRSHWSVGYQRLSNTTKESEQ